MKLLINLCAHDGIISHYTGVGTIVKRYIKTFQMILEKRMYEYEINLFTPEYKTDSFGYSDYTYNTHINMKNVNIVQISNGSDGKVNYGTPNDWKTLSQNTANYINNIDFSKYDIVLTISNDTPFAGLNEMLVQMEKHYKVWIPHSTGRIHKVDSAIKNSEKNLQERINWEESAVSYINNNKNSYLGGTGKYISKHMVDEYSLNKDKIVNILNGEILSEKTTYQENSEMEELFKDIEKENNIILAFGRAEEYKNIDATMFLGKLLNVKPVVIAQPYYKGQPIIKKYEEESKITNSKLYIDVPFDFPFYIMNHYNNNMILLIPSKKEIFGLIVNQVRKLNRNNILIVANDIGGLHEQIDDKKDGLLIDLNNLEESAHKVKKHFNSNDIVEFNKNSQIKLNDTYNFEKICAEFLNFFIKSK